jgi:hypothetical protein
MTCFFCGKAPATRESICTQFVSRKENGGRRFVVTPRCDSCAATHRAQVGPSTAIFLACPILLGIGGSFIRPWLALPGIIAGVLLGIFLASQWELRSGIKPKASTVEHERYRAVATDSENWRVYVPKRAGRMETIDDHAHYFAREPDTIAALEREYADAT